MVEGSGEVEYDGFGGDGEYVFPERVVSNPVTWGQVRRYLGRIAGGEKTKEALKAEGVTWSQVQAVFRVKVEALEAYREAQRWSAEMDEARAVSVLEDVVLDKEGRYLNCDAQLLKYLSEAYKWRAGIRNRNRFGEKVVVEHDVSGGVMVLPAPSWGRVPTDELPAGTVEVRPYSLRSGEEVEAPKQP